MDWIDELQYSFISKGWLYAKSSIKCLNIINTFVKSFEIERFPLTKQNEEHDYTSQSQSKYDKENRFDRITGIISGKKNKLVSIYNKNLKEINSNCKQNLHAIFIFESLIKFKYCKIVHINIYIRSGRQKER